jgi:predicted nucleotidyltransferase component of viral defense system
MTKHAYKKQVALLLNVLPEVAKENCFALHGGTAINLFIRDMPRLSVDIDLTYLPVEDRGTTLANVAAALERIKSNLEKVIKDARITHREGVGKLLISARGVDVKLEVNLVMRGTLAAPVKMQLCEKAQKELEAFSAIDVVPIGQLYGGKICAALDRQHPRDLFDIKYLLENEGFTNEIKEGFLLCLLSSDRPINEVISPNFQDQHQAMDNQFAGMSEEAFSYAEYEAVRKKLVKTIHEGLTKEDKEFLLSVKNVTPDWSIYNFEKFPAVAWKLQNLQKLKEANSEKHAKQYEDLKQKLDSLCR